MPRTRPTTRTRGAGRRARRDNPYAYDPKRSEGSSDLQAAAKFFVMTVLGCALAEGVALMRTGQSMKVIVETGD